jgi:hypothetical protein
MSRNAWLLVGAAVLVGVIVLVYVLVSGDGGGSGY